MSHKHWQVHIHHTGDAALKPHEKRYIVRIATLVDGEPLEVATYNYTGTERDLTTLFDDVRKWLTMNVV